MSWKPRTLSREQLEERRLMGGRLLKEGRLTRSEIARELGVSPAAVSQWAARLESGRNRLRSLEATLAAGRVPRLNPAQWQRVLRLLAKGALAHGFETDRWTLPRVRDLIRTEYGVEYHPGYLSRRLHALGWSPQVPAPRARERDDDLVRLWLDRDWPRIKKRLADSAQ
jgi:putative transposase